MVLVALGCSSKSGSDRVVIQTDKAYEAVLFRQNCAICHGPEAEGRTLETGIVVPSLRQGQFKFRTVPEIYNQITNGGNGMLPFRDQLTDSERHKLAEFVHDKLRSNDQP